MTLPWAPVAIVDVAGSVLVLVLSVACAVTALSWLRQEADDVFRGYVLLLTLAFVFFASSRSVGHLIKQILLFGGQAETWHALAGFSGAVNTAAFVAVFAFSVYFQRVRKTHVELTLYKNELELLVTRRTEELRAERERLAVTLRSIGDAVVTTDTEGRVVTLNEVAEALTGWTQQEATGRPWSEVCQLVDERTGEPVPSPIDRVLGSNEVVSLANHVSLIARDETRRSVADSAAPIRTEDGDVLGVVLVFRDIAERKRLEQELIQAQKLESVGVLAGGIAHDFNNLLTAIMGNIGAARAQPSLPANASALLGEAEKASQRAANLTGQLLTFSKGGSPVRTAASVAEVIRDSADFVLHGSSVSCETDIPEDLWLVDIDQGQMSQVVQNIILNARDAMRKGGTIRVRCRNCAGPASVSNPSVDRSVEIIITDPGVGIPAEAMDRVFDPYFTTKEHGTGLGLAVCHAVVNKHDGSIEVASQPGSGTTFTIRLPASSQPTIEPPRDLTPAPVGESARVLVVDDEPTIRILVRHLLEESGDTVVEASDGATALTAYRDAAAAGRPFDVVLMDLTIPGGMGGREAVRELLRFDPQARVIVSSGYSSDPIMASYRDYGFVGVIAKPYAVDELLRVIARALQRDTEA